MEPSMPLLFTPSKEPGILAGSILTNNFLEDRTLGWLLAYTRKLDLALAKVQAERAALRASTPRPINSFGLSPALPEAETFTPVCRSSSFSNVDVAWVFLQQMRTASRLIYRKPTHNSSWQAEPLPTRPGDLLPERARYKNWCPTCQMYVAANHDGPAGISCEDHLAKVAAKKQVAVTHTKTKRRAKRRYAPRRKRGQMNSLSCGNRM